MAAQSLVTWLHLAASEHHYPLASGSIGMLLHPPPYMCNTSIVFCSIVSCAGRLVRTEFAHLVAAVLAVASSCTGARGVGPHASHSRPHYTI